VLALGLALAGALPAAGHIVVGTRTLQMLVAESELVLHARIADRDEGPAVLESGRGVQRPAVEAEVVALLKGPAGAVAGERVRFVQHGHGVAPFAPGDETLLFLLGVDRSRELSAVAREGAVRWLSLQEHSDTYPVEPSTGQALLGAVRAYVSAEKTADTEERNRHLREAGLALLGSGDPHLAASVLRGLALEGGDSWLRREDGPRLAAWIDDPGTSMGIRIGLLRVLQRRGFPEADSRWPQLVAETLPAADRIAAIRALRASAPARARPLLLPLLEDDDAEVVAAAADALGTPGAGEAVPALASALAHTAPRVRLAAIRGLGRIADPAARRALVEAARAHPDAATRRRAAAEIRKRGGQVPAPETAP